MSYPTSYTYTKQIICGKYQIIPNVKYDFIFNKIYDNNNYDIYTIYETWCKLNKKKCLKTQKKFKEELEKLNYKEVKSKGVDMNNNPGKRGYNIMVAL